MSAKKRILKKIPLNPQLVGLWGFNLLVIGFVFLVMDRLPPEVPLFYGKPRGEEQLVGRVMLVLPPAVSMLIALSNAIIIRLTKDVFLKNVLLGLAVTATLLSTITVFKIINLVGSF